MFEKWRGAAWLTENVTDELIRLENLVKIYDTGAIRVLGLKKINLTIRRGEFVAIMGHSGSGKSTLMNILGCLDRPTLGHYYLDGIDTAALSPDELSAVRNKKIGFVFQSFNLISRTSALKNVELPMTYARIPKKKRTERAMELLKVFDLEKEADYKASNLPYGKQRKLEIARALATEPKLLLLDEPAAGMNPNETAELMETIRFVRDHFGMTILLIEHDMKLVSGICERLTVLNFGQVLCTGPTQDVLSNPEVIKAYLGE